MFYIVKTIKNNPPKKFEKNINKKINWFSDITEMVVSGLLHLLEQILSWQKQMKLIFGMNLIEKIYSY